MTTIPRHLSVLAVLFLFLASCHPRPGRTVKGFMQARPGGPMEEVSVEVHRVPVDPPSRTVAQAQLADGELVLGVVAEGQAMAWPIRYLAMYEVVDDRVLDTPLAATW